MGEGVKPLCAELCFWVCHLSLGVLEKYYDGVVLMQHAAGKYRELSSDELQKFIDGLEKKDPNHGTLNTSCCTVFFDRICWHIISPTSSKTFGILLISWRTSKRILNPQP